MSPLAAVRPYWMHAALLVYTPALLFLDGRLHSFWASSALGLLTLAVLLACQRRLAPGQRLQVWACVLVATGFEVIGSQLWGIYRYRMGGIPLYVPFGHGLVYLFGLTAADLPVFRRHGRRPALAVLGAATGYAIAGLIVLPQFTHRLDVQGAACLPVLAFCIVSTPRYALFAGIFIATLDLELAGTLAGDWTWLATAPGTGVTSGNPPSAIAGGYCWIEGAVLTLMLGWERLAAPGGRGAFTLPQISMRATRPASPGGAPLRPAERRR